MARVFYPELRYCRQYRPLESTYPKRSLFSLFESSSRVGKVRVGQASAKSEAISTITSSQARLWKHPAMASGAKLYYISAAVGIINTAAVLLRFEARKKTKAKFGVDDLFIAGSLLPLYGMIVSSVLRTSTRTGYPSLLH